VLVCLSTACEHSTWQLAQQTSTHALLYSGFLCCFEVFLWRSFVSGSGVQLLGAETCGSCGSRSVCENKCVSLCLLVEKGKGHMYLMGGGAALAAEAIPAVPLPNRYTCPDVGDSVFTVLVAQLLAVVGGVYLTLLMTVVVFAVHSQQGHLHLFVGHRDVVQDHIQRPTNSCICPVMALSTFGVASSTGHTVLLTVALQDVSLVLSLQAAPIVSTKCCCMASCSPVAWLVVVLLHG
jgi:hypothetical protein